MLLGVDLELAEDLLEDLDVRARLLEVRRPLLLEILRHGAANRHLIDIDTSALVLEGLKQKLLQLLHVQRGRSPRSGRARRVEEWRDVASHVP
jgi:hypothetical protein